MTSTHQTDPDQRRKNIRLAWIMAGFALLMFISSVPFWKGLYLIAMQQ